MRKIILMILCVCCIGWVGLIYYFSAQDGIKTADTSMKIARQAAEVIYEHPTREQIESVHVNVRKAAHIFLFLVLGMLVALLSLFLSRFWQQPWIHVLIFFIGIGAIAAIGWLDEWHKQFIEGRHYQMTEAILNIVSGLAGGGLVWMIKGVLLWRG